MVKAVDYKEAAKEIYKRFLEKVEERIGKKNLETALELLRGGYPHIIYVLGPDVLGYLSYSDSFEIIKDVVEELRRKGYPVDRFVVKTGTADDLTPDSIPVCFPLGSTGKTEVVLKFDEYQKISTKGEEKSELPFTFKDIVREALKKGASDIHIVPKGQSFHTYFRIRGQLVKEERFIISDRNWDDFIRQLMYDTSQSTKGKFSMDDRRKVQEGRVEYPDLRVDVRLVFIPDGVSFRKFFVEGRVLPKRTADIKTPLKEKLRNLGIYEDHIGVFEKILKKLGGVCVVSGKTNSGKSTLVNTVLSSLTDKRIITVEDPVEIEIPLPNVSQHQLYEPKDEDVKLGYTEYVLGIKRADPDIVFIQEWRDEEELTRAIESLSYSGQLIFTTLHINSAYEIYHALEDMFGLPREKTVYRILLSWNQILAPVPCSSCGENHIYSFRDDLPFLNLSDDEKKILEIEEEVEVRKKGKGCDKCDGLGYEGLTPVYEYFVPDDGLRDLVRKGASPSELKKYAKENGLGITKFEVFMRKLKEKLVEPEIIFKI